MSNIRTLLTFKSKQRELDEAITSAITSSAPLRHRTSFDSRLLHGNGAATMTQLESSYLKLTAVPESALDSLLKENGNDGSYGDSNTASPATKPSLTDEDDTASVLHRSPTPKQRSRSSPARELHRKLSQRLQQALGDPTVVHRPQMRSRPDLQKLHIIAQSNNEWDDSSTPSTGRDDSSSSGKNQPVSTPATSDLTSLSPVSTSQRANTGEAGHKTNDSSTHHVHFLSSNDLSDHTGPSLKPSIRTVESTAVAKIFLETHFNSLLDDTAARAMRRAQLRDQAMWLQLPADACQRALDVFDYHEKNQLRCRRLQQSWRSFHKDAKNVTIAGFEIIKVLGKGSFGVVRLVRETCSDAYSTMKGIPLDRYPSTTTDLMKQAAVNTSSICSKLRQDTVRRKTKVYAMKVIRKSEMVRNCQEGHIRAERNFLVAAQGSRWIIALLAAFQDDRFLYLVLDYCIGGDFLGLLIRRDILSEDVTKWYIAEMILCIEEAHRMKWIHRDVKPDNFLIGADGHLKISDFGLAFDGDWQHDQKYFHRHRHELLERLEITVAGDAQDQEDHQAIENSRRVAGMTHNPFKRKRESTSREEPAVGEAILDWRNRKQRRRLARSVVGTSQYMAPEIIRGDAYDGRCD